MHCFLNRHEVRHMRLAISMLNFPFATHVLARSPYPPLFHILCMRSFLFSTHALTCSSCPHFFHALCMPNSPFSTHALAHSLSHLFYMRSIHKAL
ncbi:MAG: hypothetical protein J3R72DRAFT_46657 [Linnemannia gamsii]|nr:MAG: hypothetical protein J3R72DRAFT_46657 [Linnemannia gamsii]